MTVFRPCAIVLVCRRAVEKENLIFAGCVATAIDGMPCVHVSRGLGQVLLEEELDQEAKEGALKELRFLKDRELEFFKRLVEKMVTTKGKMGKIDMFDAMKIGTQLSDNKRSSSGDEDEPAPKKFQAIQNKEAIALVERLEELGWLQTVQLESPGNSHNTKRVTLGIRSILDLQKYIET